VTKQSVLFAALVLIGCGSQNQQPTSPTHANVPRTLMSGAAPRYDEPSAAPPSSAIGDAFIAATSEIAERLHVPVPTADARLFKACAALARVVPPDVPGYSAVEFALQSNGIIEPTPHLFVVHANLSDAALAVAQVRPQIDRALRAEPIARVGVGTFETIEGGVMVVALQQSYIQTSPIPRSVAAGGSLEFEVNIAPDYHRPEIHVTRPTGDVELSPFQGEANPFHVAIGCGSSIGRLQIDIVGSGEKGVRVLANFPVWCGTEPPGFFTVDAPTNDLPSSPHEAEQRMFALINHDRDQAGVSLLVWDEDLAQIAREHSVDMKRVGMVSEILPGVGTVRDRVRVLRNGATVRLNVGRSYSVTETHRGFLSLPSTREPLTSPLMTHIGIGIMYGREVAAGVHEMFVTEVLTSSAR
jgi:hypothetical protein